MKNLKPLLLLIAVYLAVQGLGLWIAAGGLWLEQGTVEFLQENPELGVVEDPGSIASSGQIFLYIVVATAVLLLFIKFRLGFFIRAFMDLAILGGLFLTLGNLLGFFGAMAAVIVFLLRLWKPEDSGLMNLILVFALPGIGSWLGSSIDVFPTALALILVLAVYDFVAVFGTKHMVTLAENAGSGRDALPVMFSIPFGERTLGLGTGDLALPLVFSVSMLRSFPLEAAIIAAFGGLLGLLALFFYITRKKDVVLPALPPITAGLLLGSAMALFIF